jgi:hypothetical protein
MYYIVDINTPTEDNEDQKVWIVFSVAMEMQQWVPFVLLLSYKIFLTAVNSNTF